MNKIDALFDKEFIFKYFKERLLKEYAKVKSFQVVEIVPHKNGVWKDKYYHVVIEYKLNLRFDEGSRDIIVFCTAHHEEPRRNVYVALKHLYCNGFAEGNLLVPKPLFYSQRFRATFYEGIFGENFYSYIKRGDKKQIEKLSNLSAQWFAKLHLVSTRNAKNFNKLNSKIETVIPGVDRIIKNIRHRFPIYEDVFKNAYEVFVKNEKKYLKNINLHLVHGDAHPENVIHIGGNKVGLIDFADICFSDPARDLGTFTQQVEYMIERRMGDKDFAKKISKLFLEKYLKHAKIDLGDNFQERIDNYYNWTLARSATFFLLHDYSEPDRGAKLIEQFSKRLKL